MKNLIDDGTITRDKVVVLHSGGLDSSVLLYHLRDQGLEVFPLSIWYGQRHARELEFASILAGHTFPSRHVDLQELAEVLKGSSQTDSEVEVPEGHYAADNMSITVVPNRNMILFAVATAHAISLKARYVAYAAHAGDHAQYADCRPEFFNAIGHAIELCDYNAPQAKAPFIAWTKSDIVKRGAELGVPFEATWSCYKGGLIHCGRCGTCVERAEAFHLAGVPDPTEYTDKEYWKEVTDESRATSAL